MFIVDIVLEFFIMCEGLIKGYKIKMSVIRFRFLVGKGYIGVWIVVFLL